MMNFNYNITAIVIGFSIAMFGIFFCEEPLSQAFEIGLGLGVLINNLVYFLKGGR